MVTAECARGQSRHSDPLDDYPVEISRSWAHIYGGGHCYSFSAQNPAPQLAE